MKNVSVIFFLHKNKKLENHPSQPSTFINTVKA